MTPTQAVQLCRLVKACCPQQAFDEFTPDVWCDLLSDIEYGDAEVAVKNLARLKPFMSPAEIRAEVRKIRNVRLGHVNEIQPPDGFDPDNRAAYIRWRRATVKAVADGQTGPPPASLPARDMRQLESTFRRPQ